MDTEAGGGQRSIWLRTQRQHTVSSSVAREECDHPAHSAGQTSLSSHGHRAQILFITRPPTGLQAGPEEREGADKACESVLHAGVS